MSKILVISANFYDDISRAMLDGAVVEIIRAEYEYDIIEVPGALEIPSVIANADSTGQYQAYIALGCVIRGETYHFEIVCNESARGLMQLSIDKNLAIGNGIITVETEEQAWERADVKRLNKGGGAARAAIRLLEIKKQLGTMQ